MQDHAETRRPRDRPVDEDAGSPRARLRGFVNPIVRYSMSALTDVLGQPLLRRFGDFDSSRPRSQKRGRATLLIED